MFLQNRGGLSFSVTLLELEVLMRGFRYKISVKEVGNSVKIRSLYCYFVINSRLIVSFEDRVVWSLEGRVWDQSDCLLVDVGSWQ